MRAELVGNDWKDSWCESTEWKEGRGRLEYKIDIKNETGTKREQGHSKYFPLQMPFSSAFFCDSKVRNVPPLGFLWDSEVQNHQSDLAMLSLDQRRKKTQEMDGKMSLNQNNSGSTKTWRNSSKG